MWKVTVLGGFALVLGAMGCAGDAPSPMQKRGPGGCPLGTLLSKDRRHCIVPEQEQCPAGFVFEELREICYWPCDASVDAAASPFCAGDAERLDGGE